MTSTAPLPSLELLTPCRNRADHLIASLPSWLANPLIARIVIVDFGSTTPLADRIAQHTSSSEQNRLCVIRVEEEPLWRQGRAQNLGLQATRADLILKVDADIAVGDLSGYVTAMHQEPRLFFKGFSKLGTSSGLCLFRRKAGLSIGGYHDHLSGWGGDDVDFYRRLQRRRQQFHYFEAEHFQEITQPMQVKNSEAPRLDSTLFQPNDDLIRDPYFTGCRNGILAKLLRQRRRTRLRWRLQPGSHDFALQAMVRPRNQRLQPWFRYHVELANLIALQHYRRGESHWPILRNRDVQTMIQEHQLPLAKGRNARRQQLDSLPQRLETLRHLAGQRQLPASIT
jgi:glycosyltransferase involved in cell wall biosynthesis